MKTYIERAARPKLGLAFGGAQARPHQGRSPILSGDELRRIISETIG
jgi:hypothetical protein